MQVKPGLWGLALGAVAMAVVGFSWLGWTTAATSERVAKERADGAVVAAMVPFCVDKAHTDPNPRTLATFQSEQSSYARDDIVLKAGWATMRGKEGGSDTLARACAVTLHEAKAG